MRTRIIAAATAVICVAAGENTAFASGWTQVSIAFPDSLGNQGPESVAMPSTATQTYHPSHSHRTSRRMGISRSVCSRM